MKLKDLLQVLYGYNEIVLYDKKNRYIDFYYNMAEIKEEYQNQKVLSLYENYVY